MGDNGRGGGGPPLSPGPPPWAEGSSPPRGTPRGWGVLPAGREQAEGDGRPDHLLHVRADDGNLDREPQQHAGHLEGTGPAHGDVSQPHGDPAPGRFGLGAGGGDTLRLAARGGGTLLRDGDRSQLGPGRIRPAAAADAGTRWDVPGRDRDARAVPPPGGRSPWGNRGSRSRPGPCPSRHPAGWPGAGTAAPGRWPTAAPTAAGGGGKQEKGSRGWAPGRIRPPGLTLKPATAPHCRSDSTLPGSR